MFNPNGIEIAHIVQIFNVSLMSINFKIKIPNNGKIIRPAYKFVGTHKEYKSLEDRDW